MLNETQKFLERLAAADRVTQKEAGGKFLLGTVKYFCAAVLSAFLLDVILHLNSRGRLLILLATILAVCALFAFSSYLAFVRKNRAEHIARLLEARHPSLGSRLINLLQLSEQTEDKSLAPLTRDLARQAVESYATDLRTIPVERLARTDALRRQLKHAAWALVIFAAILGATFRVATTEFARFADPFGDHPPYSFTHLQIAEPGPAGTNVLYDKGLIVRVKASGHQPKAVYLTAFPPGHREQAITVPMFDKGRSGYDQLLDNIQTETLVFAHTRDHVSETKQVRIGVVLTPQLERTFVRIAPPDYTGIRPEEKPYTFKGIQALEGSTVKFRLQSNRQLREGLLEVTAGEQPPQRVTLAKSGEKEVSGSFIAAESGRMRFSFTDVSGLPSQIDLQAALTVTHDLPPEAHLANPENDSFVAMDFKLQAQIEASDDYGLRQIRFHRGLNGVYSTPKTFAYTNLIRDARETFDFNFIELGIQPGDIISLFAEALDNAPQPHLARSKVVHLQVISVDDYNNFLREKSDIADAEDKYAALNEDLQSLIEQQKQLTQEIQKLKDQVAKADAKKREALAQQLDALLAKQNEINQKLNNHAEHMDNFVRQNPLYDVEQDLQELLGQQADAIRQSAHKNDSSAKETAQQSSPAGGPRRLSPEVLDDFKKASEEQVARLGGAHDETQKQVVQKLEDMDQMQELINDFNQFEALYHAQQDLAQQVQAYNRAGQLSREDQIALKDLAATEKEVEDMLGKLRDKLPEDAKAAEKLFPKAAKSGRELADQMGERRLQPLAKQATDRMISAQGEQSFELADRLRAEMEKMFSECKGGNCPSSGELDNYLKLQRLGSKNTFSQMSRSRKFGLGMGRGKTGMKGEGESGMSGYAMTDGSTANVLGNESSPRGDSKTSRQSSRFGKGAGAVAGSGKAEVEKSDAMKNLKPINRQSGAVASETVIEEYNDVVENYFKAITTRKEKPTNDKAK